MDDKQMPESSGPNQTQLAGVPTFDAARYREHIADLDITEEQQAELLSTLWWIMAAFVDLGFSVDAVPRLLPAFAEASLESGADEVDKMGPDAPSGSNEEVDDGS
jgi:hypothetical protein